MEMVTNNKTLRISNYILEKLGCCVLSSKVYISKDDDSRLYIKALSMLINNINDFIQPRFGYHEYNDSRINCNAFLEKVKSKGIRVYAPLSINSLLGGDLLVTIKDGESWHELVCNKVEIVEYPTPIVTVYSHPRCMLSSNIVNKSTIVSLNLTERIKEIPKKYYWEACTNYLRFVQFPTELLYSVETKGEIDIPARYFTEHGESFWIPNDISYSQMNLRIDLDKKIIYGTYSDEMKLQGGRRTSNGWEDKYLKRIAYYHKAFELIFDIQKFIEELHKRIEVINGIIEISDTFNKNPYMKNIVIKFKEPLTFKHINKVLQFKVDGSEYVD